jgi:hypothetical protein
VNIPAHSPAGVRDVAQRILTIGESELKYAESEIARLDSQIHAGEQQIASQPDTGVPQWWPEYLARLRQRRTAAEASRDYWAEGRTCLDRMVNGAGMQATYLELAAAFSKDDDEARQRKIGILFSTAWSARLDYSKYRNNVRQAVDLKGKIAITAAHLANLIRQLQNTGVQVPPVFESIQELLRATDNPPLPWDNFAKWQALRHYVLGDRVLEPDTRNVVALPELQGGGALADCSSAERTQQAVRNGWAAAPDLSALLNTVAKVAREYEPKHYGSIGAALSSREDRTKQEYLRAFFHVLVDQGHFGLFTKADGRLPIPAVTKAIAALATQATGLADGGFTEGDVRAAVRTALRHSP